MSRDIRDVLTGASPDVSTRPDLNAIRRVVRARRRRRAAGSAAALATVVAVGIAGVPWLSEQMTAAPEPVPPAGTPTSEATPSSEQTPSPEPTTPTTPTTPDDDATAPVATDGEWELVGTPDAFDAGWSNRVADAVTVGDSIIAVGITSTEPAAEGEPAMNRPEVWRSTDGEDWESVDDIELPDELPSSSVWMSAVAAADDGTLVAVGSAGVGDPHPSLAWYSTDDGASWQLTQPGDEVAWGFSDVTWAQDRFMIIGNDLVSDEVPALWSSPDGRQWQRHNLPDDPILGSPSETDPSLLIYPRLGEITWSPSTGVILTGSLAVDGPPATFTLTGPADADPASWTVTQSPLLRSLAPTEQGVLAIGSSYPQLQANLVTSADGFTWEVVAGTDASEAGLDLTDVLATSDGRIVAGGTRNGERAMLWLSTDDFPDGSTEPDDAVFPDGSQVSAIVEASDGVIVFGATQTGDTPADVIIWRRSG